MRDVHEKYLIEKNLINAPYFFMKKIKKIQIILNIIIIIFGAIYSIPFMVIAIVFTFIDYMASEKYMIVYLKDDIYVFATTDRMQFKREELKIGTNYMKITKENIILFTFISRKLKNIK